MLKFLFHSFNYFKNTANRNLIKYGLVTNTVISVALRGLGDNIQQNVELNQVRVKVQVSNDNSLNEKRYDLKRTSNINSDFLFFESMVFAKMNFCMKSEHFFVWIGFRSVELYLVQIFGQNSSKKNAQLNFEKDFTRSSCGSTCFYISIHNDN
jgi:hypothetical protein